MDYEQYRSKTNLKHYRVFRHLMALDAKESTPLYAGDLNYPNLMIRNVTHWALPEQRDMAPREGMVMYMGVALLNQFYSWCAQLELDYAIADTGTPAVRSGAVPSALAIVQHLARYQQRSLELKALDEQQETARCFELIHALLHEYGGIERFVHAYLFRLVHDELKNQHPAYRKVAGDKSYPDIHETVKGVPLPDFAIGIPNAMETACHALFEAFEVER